MHRYPAGMRAWHCPLTLIEFDDVCDECVYDDFKCTVLFKQGSSFKDVMLLVHHTMATFNNKMTLRASKKHRASLKARTTISPFWQSCKEAVNQEGGVVGPGGQAYAGAGFKEDPGTG